MYLVVIAGYTDLLSAPYAHPELPDLLLLPAVIPHETDKANPTQIFFKVSLLISGDFDQTLTESIAHRHDCGSAFFHLLQERPRDGSAAAVTMMASKGEYSGHPRVPSKTLNRILV